MNAQVLQALQVLLQASQEGHIVLDIVCIFGLFVGMPYLVMKFFELWDESYKGRGRPKKTKQEIRGTNV